MLLTVVMLRVVVALPVVTMVANVNVIVLVFGCLYYRGRGCGYCCCSDADRCCLRDFGYFFALVVTTVVVVFVVVAASYVDSVVCCRCCLLSFLVCVGCCGCGCCCDCCIDWCCVIALIFVGVMYRCRLCCVVGCCYVVVLPLRLRSFLL